MKMADDRHTFPLARSSSRDNKVSCETLSHVDWYRTPKLECRDQFLYDADELYWDAADPELDLDDAVGAQTEVKSFPAAARGHLFACFPPKPASYIRPRPMMSPGREGKRGAAEAAGRYPSPIPHSGSVPHSGTIPHSGPIKLNTGAIISHSGPMKGAAKGGPSIIPADVVGKKKPPEEPTSPEVTCLGHVRLKHKYRKDFPKGAHKKQPCEWTSKFMKKKAPQDSTDKRGKQSAWRQVLGGRDQDKKAQSQVGFEEELGPSHPSEAEENRGENDAMFANSVAQFVGERGRGGEEDEAEAEYVPQVPPPNSLLLMRGSRKLEREAEAEYVPQFPPPNSLLLMRGSRNLERDSQKPRFLEAQERPTIEKKAPVLRQVSLPKPPPEASIWKRRNIAQPTALDTRNPIKLEIKQPLTK